MIVCQHEFLELSFDCDCCVFCGKCRKEVEMEQEIQNCWNCRHWLPIYCQCENPEVQRDHVEGTDKCDKWDGRDE